MDILQNIAIGISQMNLQINDPFEAYLAVTLTISYGLLFSMGL